MERRIKVIHITNTDFFVRFLLFSRLLSLKEEGYDIYVICSGGRWIPEIIKTGIKVKIIKTSRRINPVADLISLIRMIWYLQREKFDIVHTHNPKTGLLGQIAAKIVRTPIIINTVHGFYFHDNMNPWVRKFYIFWEKIAALCSDLIFSENSEDIQIALNEKICAKKKIRYLGSGVDLSYFDPKLVKSEQIREKKREIGLESGKDNIVGIVGRLVYEKGYLEFFRAAKIIKQKISNVKFLVIGPMEKEKKDAVDLNIVKELGIQNDVLYLGIIKDIPEVYSIMDVVVLPSYREGFPRTLMEASAMGKPMVATNIRGCREVIENGKTGILVPLKNQEELASGILELLRNKKKAKEMGLAARRCAEEHFNEEEVMRRLKSEYRKLIELKLK